MKLSVVIVGRNDNYGGTLNERAEYCLNTMLEVFDEVVFVDWNTDDNKPPLTDVLNLVVNRDRLVTVIIRPSDVKRIMGDGPEDFCQVFPRNIGIRKSTGDVIVLAALDIIAPRLSELTDIVSKLEPDQMITTKRNHIDIEVTREVFRQCKSYSMMRDYIFEHYGVSSINTARMFPVLTVTKDIMESIPEKSRFNAASIIGGCGDFQIAHRDLWCKIKGFEEDQIKKFYMDTEVQYKVIMSGGKVTATNFPPIYHIDHPRYFDDDKRFFNAFELYETRNSDNWGCANENFNIKRYT
jgi:hypothetical protein